MRLMSPRSTLYSCGNSSILVLRRMCPSLDMYCSASANSLVEAYCGADVFMVRNLYIVNSLPPRPTRCWRKTAGSWGLLSFCKITTNPNGMSSTKSARPDSTASVARLICRYLCWPAVRWMRWAYMNSFNFSDSSAWSIVSITSGI